MSWGVQRLAFGPLEEYVRRAFGSEHDLQISQVCGVTRRTVVRWRAVGLAVARADEIATNLGVHPTWIWGTAWWKEETYDNADGDRSAPASPSLRGA